MNSTPKGISDLSPGQTPNITTKPNIVLGSNKLTTVDLKGFPLEGRPLIFENLSVDRDDLGRELSIATHPYYYADHLRSIIIPTAVMKACIWVIEPHVRR